MYSEIYSQADFIKQFCPFTWMSGIYRKHLCLFYQNEHNVVIQCDTTDWQQQGNMFSLSCSDFTGSKELSCQHHHPPASHLANNSRLLSWQPSSSWAKRAHSTTFTWRHQHSLVNNYTHHHMPPLLRTYPGEKSSFSPFNAQSNQYTRVFNQDSDLSQDMWLDQLCVWRNI